MFEPRAPSAVRETHISWVFLAGGRAYKLLKPVEMPFLDLREPSSRLAAIDRELRLNRRIAPDVYLGVADIVEDDRIVDRMLVMRRLPDDRRLSALVADASFGDCLRAVARTLAGFHAECQPLDPAPTATRDALAQNWADNLEVIGSCVGPVIARDEHERVCELVEAYLAGRERLFSERIGHGMVRDGHGDLLAEDIFCLDDGPRILDCLAFDDRYRIGDVLLDVAFLVMDVERLAGWNRARDLMRWYVEFTAEHHPASLAHHYVAYRAGVRAKVACLRHAQGGSAAAELVRRHHRLALDHLERARVRLVLVGGGPGVGKSALAGGLAERYGAAVLATDEIRKDLTGTPRDEHRFARPDEGIYDATTSDRAYAEQLREAGLLLSRGESVVLDASWADASRRASARALAAAHHAELVELECVLDAETAKERIARRLASVWNPSDATPEIADHLFARREPWPEAVRVDTAQPPGVVLATAVRAVDRARPAG